MFSQLIFDNDMTHFLNVASRETIIAQLLLSGNMPEHIVDEGNYIKRSEDEIDVVSFLPKSKYEKVQDSDVWHNSRVKIKIGRFIRKFINEFSISKFKVTDKEIEKFVNLYKSYFSRDITKLKIVSGDDILKYYHENSYYSLNGNRHGTLWNSCMRQSERNKFMKLYAKNPSVKMLVFFSDDEKVRARALLWEGVKEHNKDTNEYKFMDRIYYVYDHDVSFFKDWAKENDYITKWEQNAKSELFFDTNQGQPTLLNLYVNLDDNFSYFPYLDTFKYYNTYKKRFSNSEGYQYDFKLVQSNGQVERDPEPEEEMFYDDDDN